MTCTLKSDDPWRGVATPREIQSGGSSTAYGLRERQGRHSTGRRARRPARSVGEMPERKTGGVVSELLSLLHMTQTELAQVCGLSSGYLSQLMNGKRSPSPESRRLIQEALGVSDFDRLFIMEPADEPCDE